MECTGTAFGGPSVSYGLGRTWVTFRREGQLIMLHTHSDERPDRATWSSFDSVGTSNHDPVMHFDGRTLWLTHVGTDGTPYLRRRTRATNSDPGTWSSPLQVGGETPPTVLGAPGIAHYKGRMYAFYHA